MCWSVRPPEAPHFLVLHDQQVQTSYQERVGNPTPGRSWSPQGRRVIGHPLGPAPRLGDGARGGPPVGASGPRAEDGPDAAVLLVLEHPVALRSVVERHHVGGEVLGPTLV